MSKELVARCRSSALVQRSRYALIFFRCAAEGELGLLPAYPLSRSPLA